MKTTTAQRLQHTSAVKESQKPAFRAQLMVLFKHRKRRRGGRR